MDETQSYWISLEFTKYIPGSILGGFVFNFDLLFLIIISKLFFSHLVIKTHFSLIFLLIKTDYLNVSKDIFFRWEMFLHPVSLVFNGFCVFAAIMTFVVTFDTRI